MQIQIQSVHFDADAKLLEFIDKKVAKLTTYYEGIVRADVILRLEPIGHVQDKVAEIVLHVPGHNFVAKESYKSFEQATDECIDSLRRQLIKHKERVRNPA